MKIIDHKDAINRRLYKGLFIVKTAIYRVSCLNRTVLRDVPPERLYMGFGQRIISIAIDV
ncbi:MAG: hypothetical protein KME54_26335 [Tolypothrix brevis GSE-NOS-MK-07-07A]|nr:hypothetical protein [Tolypothrix brevis GSE-NOS-MK-07-07A]